MATSPKTAPSPTPTPPPVGPPERDFLYFCAICGCPTFCEDPPYHDWSDWDPYGDQPAFTDEPLLRAKWLREIHILLLRPSVSIKFVVSDNRVPTRGHVAYNPHPELPSTRSFLTHEGVVELVWTHPELKGKQLSCFMPKDTYGPSGRLGVYDFTEKPFPGVIFPMHTNCYKILFHRIRHRMHNGENLPLNRVSLDDIHEALSLDWAAQPVQSVTKDGEPWGRTRMTYPHNYYGAGPLTANDKWDFKPGWEWLLATPFPQSDDKFRVLIEGLPKLRDAVAVPMEMPPMTGPDPFSALPLEIVEMILRDLTEIHALKHLRQASPYVRRLQPISNLVYWDIFLELDVMHYDMERNYWRPKKGWGHDIDWKKVLEMYDANDFSIFDDDAHVKNYARISKCADALAKRVCGEVRKARERGEEAKGAGIWGTGYENGEDEGMNATAEEAAEGKAEEEAMIVARAKAEAMRPEMERTRAKAEARRLKLLKELKKNPPAKLGKSDEEVQKQA